MKRLILIASLVVVCLMAVVVVWALPKREEHKPPAKVPTVYVQVEVVEPVPTLADRFALPGVVEPNTVVDVAAEVEGRVEAIACREGDTCRAGTLIVKLNTELLQAEYDRHQAQLEFDEKDFNRQQRLFKQGATNEKDLEHARSRLAISRANVKACLARLQRATIESPAAGTLNSVPVDKGEYVTVGTVVARIVDMSVAIVAVDVPERDINYFTPGETGKVTTTVAGESRHIEGAITYISELADPATRATRMEISVPNEPRVLRSGQIVDVVLTRRMLKDVIMVPLAAVIPLEDGKVVYLAEKTTRGEGEEAQEITVARSRRVQLGFIRGDRIRVTAGLEPGDRLIVKGHRFVSDGQQVTLAEDGTLQEDAPAGASPR